MNAMPPYVAVVDDDESIRESLPDLLKSLGYSVEVFSSAEDFLASANVRKTDCLVLDIAMPGMTGPQLHRELTQRGHSIPTVFITAQRDDAIRPRMISHGAVDCLFKPFSASELQNALASALCDD